MESMKFIISIGDKKTPEETNECVKQQKELYKEDNELLYDCSDLFLPTKS